MKLTIISSRSNIGKKYYLEDGELKKDDVGNLSRGHFETVEIEDIDDLKEFVLKESNSKQIMVLGTTRFRDGLVTTKQRLHEFEHSSRHVVTRSRDFFSYFNNDKGFMVFDYDPNEHDTFGGDPISKEKFGKIVSEVIPELHDTPQLWKTSSSSCIFSAPDKGNEVDASKHVTYKGVHGQHKLIAVRNVADIERVADIFYKRFWLNGYGYIFVDKVGRMHERTIIDRVVNSPERALFLHSDFGEGLKQQIFCETSNRDGVPLNTTSISELTYPEEEKYLKLVADAKKKKAKYCDSVRQKYLETNAEILGVSQKSLSDSIDSRRLFQDFVITIETGEKISVKDIVSDPEKYNGAYCYDPFEPGYGGSAGGTKAWIDLGVTSRIFSHAHGGINYELIYNEKPTPYELSNRVCGEKDHTTLFLNAATESTRCRYEATEDEALCKAIHKMLDIALSTVKKSFANAKKKIGSKTKNSNVGTGNGSVPTSADLTMPLDIPFHNVISDGNGNEKRIDTPENLKIMLDGYAINYFYEPILKKRGTEFPKSYFGGADEFSDNRETAHEQKIESLCLLNGMSRNSSKQLPALMINKEVNVIRDWIVRTKWDGEDRIQELMACIDVVDIDFELSYTQNRAFRAISEGKANGKLKEFMLKNSITTEHEYAELKIREKTQIYKERVMHTWLIQAIAALDGCETTPIKDSIPKYENVLVFVGAQGKMKTTFVKSLLPREKIFNKYIQTGVMLDIKDKDSVKMATSCWIVELGELDSTFKKSDVGSLKNFLSRTNDNYRLPYGSAYEDFKRRTVFTGSVNSKSFLVDSTGNRRYFPLEVSNINISRVGKIDLQQMWSQVLSEYQAGAQWWPDSELDEMLNEVNGEFTRDTGVTNGLDELYRLECSDKWKADCGVKNNILSSKDSKYKGDSIFECTVINASELLEKMRVDITKPNLTEIDDYLFSKGIKRKAYSLYNEGGERRVKKGYKLVMADGNVVGASDDNVVPFKK